MPSQISPPIEYFDGDPINAAAFNGHVKDATLQNGSISEQVALTLSVVPVIDKTDNLVILDNSEPTTNKLRKVKVEDLFSSGAPIIADSVITSSINAKTNKEIDIAPNAGVFVNSKNFVCIDGLNITVTSTAHLLESGMLVEISNAAFGGPNGSFISNYDGRYQVTVLTVDTFTYSIPVITVGGSGTLNYRKAATVYVAGSEVINDDLRVAGNAFIAGNTTISGSANVGSLKIAGKTPLTKEDSLIGIETKVQILPPTGWNTADYQTWSFNVPPGETWTFVWNSVTVQVNPPGNTRPEGNYQWQIRALNLTGPVVDTVQCYTGSYGGNDVMTRILSIRNEGTTGNTHTVISPTATTVVPGTMSLVWSAIPIGGRSKWDTNGQLVITLYKQKTNTMAGQSGSGIPNVL